MVGDGMWQSDGRAEVLIADSDRRVRQALRALLQTDPQLVIAGEADSVDELRRLTARKHPAAIVLDVLLPRAADGLRAITDISRELHCPILVLTNGLKWRDAALQAGAREVLDKGIDADLLLRAVSRLVHPDNI